MYSLGLCTLLPTCRSYKIDSDGAEQTNLASDATFAVELAAMRSLLACHVSRTAIGMNDYTICDLGDRSLSNGALAGIIVGSAVGAIAIVVVAFLIMKKWTNKKPATRGQADVVAEASQAGSAAVEQI